MKRGLGLVIAVVLALTAPATAQTLAKPLPPISVRGSVPIWNVQAPVLVAKAKGFFDEVGLRQVDWKVGGLDVETLRGLAAGGFDIQINATSGTALRAIAQGAPIKIIAGFAQQARYSIFVKQSMTAADLKGKTIAVSAPGSLPDLVARALFTQLNLAPSDIRTASLGSDLDRFKALLSGVVDAAIVTEELMAVAPKDVRLMAAGRDALPNYVRLCLTMSGKTIAQKRDLAVRFLAAEIEALRYAFTHRDETIALTREIIDSKPDDPRAAYVYDTVVKHHDVDPEIAIPMDKLDWMQNDLVKTGNLDRPGDLGRIVDTSLRAEALKLAGNSH